MTRIREDSPAFKRMLSQARSALEAGRSTLSLPVADLPPELAAQAREQLQRAGHHVRLTRESLDITFGPQRVQERGHPPG